MKASRLLPDCFRIHSRRLPVAFGRVLRGPKGSPEARNIPRSLRTGFQSHRRSYEMENRMRVQIIATGKVLDLPRHPILEALSEAGILKFMPDPTAKKPIAKLTWNVTEVMTSGELCLGVTCSCGETAKIYKPTHNARWTHCGVAETVPAKVFAEYRQLRERGDSPEMAERRDAVQAVRSAAERFIET